MSETDALRSAREWVVVTGAGRNIGAHMAGRFLDDGYGVIAQFRSRTDALDALVERGAHPVQGEFGESAACLEIAERIADAAPTLRAIVHNASAFAPSAAKPLAAGEQFQTYFDVHMRAPYLLNTRLAPLLRHRDGAPADIVHITDIYADLPAAQYDLYCASKAGLQNLALSFAKRLAPDVKVNAIQPGPISFPDWHDPASRQQVVDATLLARTGTPEAIYRAICAVMANDFQTGAVIAVDGGRRLGRR